MNPDELELERLASAERRRKQAAPAIAAARAQAERLKGPIDRALFRRVSKEDREAGKKK